MINHVTSYVNNRNQPSFRANPLPREFLKYFSYETLKAKTFVIVPHKKPDKDAVGAAVGVYNFLKAIGKKVSILINENDAKDLFLKPGMFKIKKNTTPVDLAIAVDFNAKERRPNNLLQLLDIIFDHHSAQDLSIEGHAHIDDTAKSCSAIIFRLYEAFGLKPNQDAAQYLYRGIISDAEKSGYIKIKDYNGVKKLRIAKKYRDDIKSMEIFDKLKHQIKYSNRQKIYNNLNNLSNLTKPQRDFQSKLYSQIKFTPNGKFAYVAIDPHDKKWLALGMDNPTTSDILRDFRLKIISNNKTMPVSNEIRKKIRGIDGVFVLYRSGNNYNISSTSHNGFAYNLVTKAAEINPKAHGGGHPKRAGGGINTHNSKDVREYIDSIIKASELIYSKTSAAL